MDEELSAHDVGYGLEFEVAARRRRVSAALLGRSVIVPLAHVLAGLLEGLADREFDAHPGGGEAKRAIALAEGVGLIASAFGVLAERKFDGARHVGDYHLLGGLAPFQLEDDVLAADGVGAAVQGVNRRRPARELAGDVDVRIVSK